MTVFTMGPDGLLLPAGAVLRRLRGERAASLASVVPLVSGTSCLPDLLALAGIERLTVQGPSAPGPWTGRAGGKVLLTAGAAAHDAATPGERSGSPGAEAGPTAEPGWSERLEDATALWAEAAADPVPATLLGAANPLAVERQALVSLPWDGGPVAALGDSRGARHPVQDIGLPGAPLLLCSLPLGALATTSLTPLRERVPGAQWETTLRVLDNGRVRAEFDAAGRLVRLCCDGTFATWREPALGLRRDGQPLGGPVAVHLVESGPVRATLQIERPEIRLTIRLSAHSDLLEIAAQALVPGCTLDVPAAAPAAPLGWDLLGSRHPIAPGATAAVVALLVGDRLGCGLGVVSRSPMRVTAGFGGGVSLAVPPQLHCGLLSGARPTRSPYLEQARGALVPHLSGTGTSRDPLLRVVAAPSVAVAWIAPCPGWTGEVLLQEGIGVRSRVWLYPGSPAAGPLQAEVLLGGPVGMPAHRDGDGCVLDLPADAPALVRWRVRRPEA